MNYRQRNIFAQLANKLNTNREYKDCLFRMVFQNKSDLLDLYNAIHGTDYNNPEDLTITTMEDAVYLGMKNDISFLIESTINLYEHQSTVNPNMPLRGFLYFAGLIRTYVEEHDLDLYSSKRVRLPLPQYVVFYNGTDKEPDRTELCLSDAFGKKDGACLECKATLLNINYGHNQKLINKCRRLEEYTYFVAAVRSYLQRGHKREAAINQAVDECIGKGMLVDILLKNRGEVVDMLLTEFNLERYGNVRHKDGYIDGKEDGRQEGIQAFILEFREEGFTRDRILLKLQNRFQLNEKQALEYWEEYAKEDCV